MQRYGPHRPVLLHEVVDPILGLDAVPAGVELADANGTLVAGVPGELRAVRAATGPHPGLPADTAPQLAALLTQARGTSAIDERIYPRRDTHVAGLHRFGADVHTTGTTVHPPGGRPVVRGMRFRNSAETGRALITDR
ncbi:hypothetical protein [Nonomuraea sp. NPDC049129]|uniref:hypothetical protein n=1 Tax=Nonomuraea sp. NPDC049129 TaxID=3155272 RepID=UPI0033CBB267